MRNGAAAMQKYSIPYYIQGLAGLSSRQGQGVAVDENKILVVEVQLERGKDDTSWLCKCSISEKKEMISVTLHPNCE